ncbi:MAG: hypothetical protein ACQEXO_17055 [Pseudomonadota bacterium]
MSVIDILMKFYLKCFLRCRHKVKLAALLGLVFLTLRPVAEVLFIKMIADSFLAVASGDNEVVGGYGFYFIASMVLLLVYSFSYVSKVGRISYVNHVVEMLEQQGIAVNQSHKAWMRAALIEATQIITWVIQILVILAISLYIEFWVSLPLFLMVAVSLLADYYLFSKQLYQQKKLKFNKRDHADKVTSMKVRSRVRSAELVNAVINIMTLLMFLFFIVMVVEHVISPEVGVVFIFIARIFNITLTGVSGSSMRLARAAVYAEGGIEIVVNHKGMPDSDERHC